MVVKLKIQLHRANNVLWNQHPKGCFFDHHNFKLFKSRANICLYILHCNPLLKWLFAVYGVNFNLKKYYIPIHDDLSNFLIMHQLYATETYPWLWTHCE